MLMITMIFLIVLTLLGLTASQSAILEERMAGNARDRSIAMQSAEIALRRAEQHVMQGGMDINGFAEDCTNGLCEWQDGNPVWADASRWDDVAEGDDAIQYSDTTLANGVATYALAAGPDLPDGVDDPQYLIEGRLDESISTSGGVRKMFRITVRAQGINPNTVVWLQEIAYRDL